MPDHSDSVDSITVRTSSVSWVAGSGRWAKSVPTSRSQGSLFPYRIQEPRQACHTLPSQLFTGTSRLSAGVTAKQLPRPSPSEHDD